MKVTAILPDELVEDVQKYTGGRNITDSLSLALNEWVRLAKLRSLNRRLGFEERPVEFQPDFTAAKIRTLNRKRT